jgi:hypothetical protein
MAWAKARAALSTEREVGTGWRQWCAGFWLSCLGFCPRHTCTCPASPWCTQPLDRQRRTSTQWKPMSHWKPWRGKTGRKRQNTWGKCLACCPNPVSLSFSWLRAFHCHCFKAGSGIFVKLQEASPVWLWSALSRGPQPRAQPFWLGVHSHMHDPLSGGGFLACSGGRP